MSSPPSNSSGSSDEKPSQAFDLLNDKVKRWVWKREWNELRDIQESAIPTILQGDVDVIISAATARGKTEAAFLPICSRLVEEAGQSVRVLYLSPLKALINDQFLRLEELCDQLSIRVHKWHGDVDAGNKRKLIEHPNGILLITPESLEALFVVHGTKIKRIFGETSYVVVDELHAFIGNERGRQLQSLLHRLELGVRRRMPRIALSATLGDMSIAAEFLRPGHGQQVKLIISSGGEQELKLQLRGYVKTRERSSPEGAEKSAQDPSIVDADVVTDGDVQDISRHMFRTLRGSNNLVFANSRREVEVFADCLRRRSDKNRVPNEFWAHHGSLSKELRQEVESRLKKRTGPITAVCTSTLELGIDIGTVASIAQVGVPPSVASMRQRMGRSGRRGEPAVMRIHARERELERERPIVEQIRPHVVQATAMVLLMVDKWYEPPLTGALHLSTLVQQVLSAIAQYGGIDAAQAWKSLCGSGPFSRVDEAMFVQLLRALGETDLLSQASDGTLLLGEKGERIVNHYSFFAAFSTPDEYRLVTQGKTLGTLPITFPLDVGFFLIFGGRRWRVIAVDDDHKVIELARARGGRPPMFGGSLALVHDRIRELMLKIYCSQETPPFLDAQALDLLEEGRANFERYDLSARRIVREGPDSILIVWKGDRVLNTIMVQLKAAGLEVTKEDLALRVNRVDPSVLKQLCHRLVKEGPADGETLAATVKNKRAEKYDWTLPEDLLNLEYAARGLDTKTAWRALSEIVR